jgi:undecaprenyl-diphosphatase
MTGKDKNAIRRAQERPSSALTRMVSVFTFINRRRPDKRFPVLPMADATLFAIGGILLIFLAYTFLDARLLAMSRTGRTGANDFFDLLTHLGESNWLLWGSGLGMLALSLRPAFDVHWRLQPVWHRTFLTFWFIFSSVALSGLIANLFKYIFGRSRPPFIHDSSVWQSDMFRAGYAHASFPSGHATTAGALAMALGLLFPQLRIPVFAACILIAMTRPILGVHFPSDIVAGFLLGMGFTWIWARSFARKQLLFRFDQRGRLELRGEGRGAMHRLGDILLGRKETLRGGSASGDGNEKKTR